MSLAEKRSKHQRSLTLTSLPSNIISENKSSPCFRSSLVPQNKGITSPEKSSVARKVLSLNCEEHRTEDARGVSRSRSTIRPKPKSLARKISSNDFNQSHSLLTCTKSSSGSTNIFSKVKDKIVETVYQTQDMPHWAAIVQEKRQKAADQCEAKIAFTFNKEFLNPPSNTEEEDERENGIKIPAEEACVTTMREKAVIGKREKARQGFRRRSISQDSYPTSLLLPKSCPLTSKKSSDGITCSSGDFQAILQGFNNYMKHARGTSSASSASSMLSKQGENKSSNKQIKDFDVENIQASSDAMFLRIPNEGNLSKIVEDDASPKPIATEVEYDENGQTWGVYGAEIDPKILGDAIQLHLQKIINQNMEKSESKHKVSNRQDKHGLRKLKSSRHPCFVSRLFCFFERKTNQF